MEAGRQDQDVDAFAPHSIRMTVLEGYLLLADGEVGRGAGLASDADYQGLFAYWCGGGDFEVDLHQTYQSIRDRCKEDAGILVRDGGSDSAEWLGQVG